MNVKLKSKIFLWFILFIIVPIILGYLIMKPILVKPQKINLPKDNEKLELSVDLKETPFYDFSRVLFGTPLKLKWYKVCLDNKNEVSINEIKIQLPYDKDPETGAMKAIINFSGGESYKIYTPINKQICDYVKFNDSLANITMIYRKPLLNSFNPVVKVVQSEGKSDITSVRQNAYVHIDKSEITLENRLDEFIYKLIVFIIGWNVAFVSLLKSWNILSKRKTN